MDYRKILIATVILATAASATVLDGVRGFGLGDNAARTGLLQKQKTLEFGVTVKEDASTYQEQNNYSDIVVDFSNKPWVAWSDTIYDGFYKVRLGYDSWTSKTDEIDRKDIDLQIEYAQDLGGIIAGIRLGYADNSTRIKGDSKRTNVNPLTIGLGAAIPLNANQTILAGYNTGTDYDEYYDGKKIDNSTNRQPTAWSVGYVHTIDKTLELGAQLTNTWYSGFDSTNTIGLAASFLPMNGLELQAYLNITDGFEAETEIANDKGWNQKNFGLNARWTPDGNIGTIIAGLDITDLRQKGVKLNNTDKEVVGTLGYSFAF